jgi:GT2 family glycosyltransferase
MKLSVVIVNYNVRYFLEQCLLSVEKAIAGLDTEVFVVDNNSVDGSVSMVAMRFPWVKLIANKDNTGFSRANNQAMRISTGDYILLLNPDTVVEEDTFRKVIEFMDQHPDAGGLGVKMVDGKGIFLPESKRGLPTPAVSFFKIFGISRLFLRSERFNRYHLGHLSKDETHEIEILSGAFMLMRKKTLDQVGLLDEDFFMYGEDIDLSWRIIQGGWKNYYFPHTSIIHYKGESTKKGSLNYVFVFYNAMVIFAKKHFSQKNAALFSFFIHAAIWMRAFAAVLSRFIRRMWLPVMDCTLVLVGLFVIKFFYASAQHKIYDDSLVTYAFIAYSGIWIFSSWVGGAYDKPLKPQLVFKPLLIGSAVILMGYSLLPESMRFSRAIILLGSSVALLVLFLNRVLISYISYGHSGIHDPEARRVGIVGLPDEVERVVKLLSQLHQQPSFIATIRPDETVRSEYTGTIAQLSEIVRVHNIEQVIFCARDITSSDIIANMSSIAKQDIEFKIAPPESLYIIGSGSIETSADAFMLDVNSVSLPGNKRLKRIFDILCSLILLVFLPVLLFVVHQPLGLLGNIVLVLYGKKSWVGYSPSYERNSGLPKLKIGVLWPSMMQENKQSDNSRKLDVLYAKDYRFMFDLTLILRARRYLGNH